MKLEIQVKMERASVMIWEPVKPHKNDNHVRKHKWIPGVMTATDEVWKQSVKLKESHIISVFKTCKYRKWDKRLQETEKKKMLTQVA